MGSEADPNARMAERLSSRIQDERVLAAVASVRRELFVPGERREEAWDNVPLPIGAGQTISQPLVVARMCELLELEGDERVLDVGTGSGYHAALLGRLAAWVWTIERHPELAQRAVENLRQAGLSNVTVLVGDGSLGHPEAAPYEAINVAAAARDAAPPALEAQLAVGGRMVLPVDGAAQRLVRISRRADGGFERQALDPVRFVPLVTGAAAAPE